MLWLPRHKIWPTHMSIHTAWISMAHAEMTNTNACRKSRQFMQIREQKEIKLVENYRVSSIDYKRERVCRLGKKEQLKLGRKMPCH